MFADAVRDWTDWDAAAFQVGIALGIFPDSSSWADSKHVFWTANPLGDQLHQILLALVTAGVLERRDEPDEQFRWTAEAHAGPDA